ncbi:MAG: hypothetical protein JWN81_868 [Solirubrobacterales bacterium]|nr:hypothetical protein [Solirubrobacterales bacterium]
MSVSSPRIVTVREAGRARAHIRLSGRLLAPDAALAAILLALAIALWLVSLSSIHVGHLGSAGLPPALPGTWYAALAICLLGTVASVSRSDPNPWIIGAYIAAAVIVLYGTVPALADAPQYAWTYKHIGVTRLLEARGAVSPNVDIYNRWPGFFAVTAAFSRVAGVDPLSYAGWFEPLSVLTDVGLVAAIAQAVVRDIRVTGTAALLFACTNWVGQNYYSPQAVAYTLDLALMLIIIRRFTANGKIAPRVMRLVAFVMRRPQPQEAIASSLRWPRWTSIAIVVAIDAVIVATHELTPYMVVFQVAALTLMGIVRPRWLVIVFAALAVGYLLPNLSYVSHHYGLFQSLNPIENAQVQPGALTFRDWFHAHVGQLLSYAAALLTIVFALRLARRGYGSRVLPLGVLAAIPFLILFGQNYGGEASLRVFLFSSPWRDVVIAWGLVTLGTRIRLGATVAAVGLLVTLFVFAFLGNATTNIIPGGEVRASEHFYSHAPAGAVLMLAGEDFPLRSGARYADMAGPPGDHSPDLLENHLLGRKALGSADLPTVVNALHRYSRYGFIVFSTTQLAYADIFGSTRKGALTQLERAIAASPRFHLWYATGSARIYELTDTTSSAAGGL